MPTECRDSDPLLGGGTISRGVLYQGGVLYASRYGTHVARTIGEQVVLS